MSSSSRAVCNGPSPHPEWSNSLGQSPCLVFELLFAQCLPNFVIPPLGALDNYWLNAPASSCACNVPSYNLLQACQWCQGGLSIAWPIYSANCTTTPPLNYPFPIPSGTRLPAWSLVDTRSGLGWNHTLPERVQGAATTYTGQTVFTTVQAGATFDTPSYSQPVTRYSPTTSTPITEANESQSSKQATSSPAPSSGSGGGTNVGAIVGGVVAGVVVLAGAAVLIVWLLVRSRRRAAGMATAATQQPVSEQASKSTSPSNPNPDIANYATYSPPLPPPQQPSPNLPPPPEYPKTSSGIIDPAAFSYRGAAEVENPQRPM